MNRWTPILNVLPLLWLLILPGSLLAFDSSLPVPLSENSDFVAQQYRDFLNREAEPEGLEYWMAELQNRRVTRAQVVDSFFRSLEFQDSIAPAVRLYFAYFNRIPDYPGILYWIEQLRSGASLDAISQSFANSPEFGQTYGALSNSAFIDLVYANVLGRLAEPEGRAYWIGKLNEGLSRGQLMIGFSESPEYRQRRFSWVQVTTMYFGLLRRVPEKAGFDEWVASVERDGNSVLNMIGGFMASEEYVRRFIPDLRGPGGGMDVYKGLYIFDRGRILEIHVPRCVPNQYLNCRYGGIQSPYMTIKSGQVWSMRLPFSAAATAASYRFSAQAAESGENGTLSIFDLAISEQPGDFEPLNANCKIKAGRTLAVADQEAGTPPRGTCPIKRHTTYYFNMRPALGYPGETQCGVSASSTCLVRLFVPSLPLTVEAGDDDFSGSAVNGVVGGTTASIYNNDKFAGSVYENSGDALNGSIFRADDVVSALTNNGGLIGATINAVNGRIVIPARTVAGEYTLIYQICEYLNPKNCDTATARVKVAAP